MKEKSKKEIKEKNTPIKEKRIHFRTILFLIIACFILMVVWARYISTTGLIVKEYNVTNSRLPENFHGLKIIHFSDTHYGTTINKKEMERIVKEINLYRPDIVVFTGDLFDKDITIKDSDVETLGNLLKSIDASLEKLAVRGNHDYVNDYFERVMEMAEFIVLNNETKRIYYKGETPILIKGLPSITQEIFDPNEEELEDEEQLFRIVLAHEPDSFDQLDLKPDLMLTGHSHGGQIRLPFWGAIHTAVGAKRFHEERYVIGNTELFVSSGLGTTQINFRFLNRPSFNLYRLYSH